MECMEHASALALAVYERELRQLGERQSPEGLAEALYRRILPHQNRGSLHRRPAELTAQFQSVLEKTLAPSIRSEAEDAGGPAPVKDDNTAMQSPDR